MKKRYAWSRHSDDEIWYGGPCDSIKECVDEALAEEYELSDTFALGLIEPYILDIDFADMIVEHLQEDAYAEIGEVTNGWLDHVHRDDLTALDEQIKQVVNEWLKKVKEEPTFYTIAPFEECTLSEALDMHQERVNYAVKGGKF
jgi:hypothetical protein